MVSLWLRGCTAFPQMLIDTYTFCLGRPGCIRYPHDLSSRFKPQLLAQEIGDSIGRHRLPDERARVDFSVLRQRLCSNPLGPYEKLRTENLKLPSIHPFCKPCILSNFLPYTLNPKPLSP